MFDFWTSAFVSVVRVWVGAGTSSPETRLWWGRANRPLQPFRALRNRPGALRHQHIPNLTRSRFDQYQQIAV
jgi:hypothetical protein